MKDVSQLRKENWQGWVNLMIPDLFFEDEKETNVSGMPVCRQTYCIFGSLKMRICLTLKIIFKWTQFFFKPP